MYLQMYIYVVIKVTEQLYLQMDRYVDREVTEQMDIQTCKISFRQIHIQFWHLILQISLVYIWKTEEIGNTTLGKPQKISFLSSAIIDIWTWTYHVRVCLQVFLLVCYNIFQKLRPLPLSSLMAVGKCTTNLKVFFRSRVYYPLNY